MLICWNCLQECRHVWWMKISLPGSLAEPPLQATGSSADHLEGYFWAKNMEALRGLISPAFLASCSSLDNVPGFLILGLLRAIKAPRLPRPMAVHLQYKTFGYYKLGLKKLWKNSIFFLDLAVHFPAMLSTIFLFNRYGLTVINPVFSGCGSARLNFSVGSLLLDSLFWNKTKTFSLGEQV